MIKNKYLMRTHVVTQSSGNLVSDMDGEKVMLSIRNGKYYNLGEIGGVIWDRLSAPVSIDQLIGRLMEEFDVEPSVCEEQVLSFLERLLEEELILAGAAGNPS